jgi:two-component system OmpR family response regulator
MTARLLLVEDDRRIVAVLRLGLEAEGYAVDVARDGRKALEQVQLEQYALIILDRMMPGLDGLEVCRRLRKAGNQNPILMLTAKDALQDKIDGLKGGADDYVTKPFAFGEVIARIEAQLLRRSPAERPATLQVGDLRLDRAAKVAWRGTRPIPLTAKEFALLEYLMTMAGTVVNREELLSKVWNLNFDPGTKVVDVHVRFLRRKIDEGETEPLIRTVRGFGYTISTTSTLPVPGQAIG